MFVEHSGNGYLGSFGCSFDDNNGVTAHILSLIRQLPYCLWYASWCVVLVQTGWLVTKPELTAIVAAVIVCLSVCRSPCLSACLPMYLHLYLVNSYMFSSRSGFMGVCMCVCVWVYVCLCIYMFRRFIRISDPEHTLLTMWHVCHNHGIRNFPGSLRIENLNLTQCGGGAKT